MTFNAALVVLLLKKSYVQTWGRQQLGGEDRWQNLWSCWCSAENQTIKSAQDLEEGWKVWCKRWQLSLLLLLCGFFFFFKEWIQCNLSDPFKSRIIHLHLIMSALLVKWLGDHSKTSLRIFLTFVALFFFFFLSQRNPREGSRRRAANK